MGLRKALWAALLRLLVPLSLVLLPTTALSSERLHVLIPAGPGGGLDSTARALGNALTASGARTPVSYENMTGGGGGRAMAHFIETADRQEDAVLINSTPLIVRSLQGLFPHSHRDLIPVAGLVAEHSAFAVRSDSGFASWSELTAALDENPRAITVGGGSVRGSLDHIVLALALDAAEIDPRRIRYLPYDAGGKAMLALLGGEIDLLSTGIGETLGYTQSGDVRVLATTAPGRVDAIPETPTLTELGYDLVFANWRGIFAAPDTSPDGISALEKDVLKALETDVWEAALTRYGWTQLDLMGDEFGAYLDAQEAQLRTTLVQLGFLSN